MTSIAAITSVLISATGLVASPTGSGDASFDFGTGGVLRTGMEPAAQQSNAGSGNVVKIAVPVAVVAVVVSAVGFFIWRRRFKRKPGGADTGGRA